MEAEETPAHIALLLHSLVEVTLYHFALEEGLMQATRYPHLEKHRAEHGWLMEQTRNLQEPLSDPTLDDTMLRILASSIRSGSTACLLPRGRSTTNCFNFRRSVPR
jgi:hemerythrin-like metal-binding protein